MIPDQWQKAKELFDAALERSPDERLRFLDENCGDGDEAVRREVASLLANAESAAGFLEQPAIGEVAEIIVKEKLENEPTKIFSAAETPVADDDEEPPDENALCPSRLRFALVCLLFVFVVGVSVINLVPQFTFKSEFPEWRTVLKDRREVIAFVNPNFADRMQVGDELVSINNERVNDKNLWNILVRINEGERYTMQLRRGAELREVELAAQPLSLRDILFQYLFGIILPAMFFFTGLAVFLL